MGGTRVVKKGEAAEVCWVGVGQLTIEVKRLDHISQLWFAQRNFRFMHCLVEWEKLSCYCQDGTDGPDRPDSTRVRLRDRRQQAPYQERHHCLFSYVRWREVASATTFTSVAGGVQYLCQCIKIIIIHYTQIRTALWYNILQIVRTIQLYYELLQTVQTMKTYQERTCRKY